MKSIPTIDKFMTTLPHSIGSDQTVKVAEELMHKHHIRHLPVLNEGRLTGIISDRDIKLYLGLSGTSRSGDLVSELVQDEPPFAVAATTSLDEVAEIMAEKKLGSALVTDNGKLVGIFTSVDALKALSELLQTRLKK